MGDLMGGNLITLLCFLESGFKSECQYCKIAALVSHGITFVHRGEVSTCRPSLFYVNVLSLCDWLCTDSRAIKGGFAHANVKFICVAMLITQRKLHFQHEVQFISVRHGLGTFW